MTTDDPETQERLRELKHRLRKAHEAYLASDNCKKLAEVAAAVNTVLRDSDELALVLRAYTELFYEEQYYYSREFPRYELVVDGHSHWLTLYQAGVAYDNNWVPVSIGGHVLHKDGTVRDITDQERARISDLADEHSASK